MVCTALVWLVCRRAHRGCVGLLAIESDRYRATTSSAGTWAVRTLRSGRRRAALGDDPAAAVLPGSPTAHDSGFGRRPRRFDRTYPVLRDRGDSSYGNCVRHALGSQYLARGGAALVGCGLPACR